MIATQPDREERLREIIACDRVLHRPGHIHLDTGTRLMNEGQPSGNMQALGNTSFKVLPINPGDKLTFP